MKSTSMFTHLLRLVVASALLMACTARASVPLDTLVLGNSASESAHALVAVSSEVVAGQLGEPARRLLPLSPTTENGGTLTFTMAVDPVRRNYFTIKLWGGDDTDLHIGRLYLFVPLNGTDYQVGYRHEGDYAPLSVAHWSPPLPGRFFYSTTLLPLSMTQGKTSLTLKIVSTGRLYGFGTGGPTSSGPYQYAMDRPSRPIYRVYTHTAPYLDVTGETQGSAPPTSTRFSPGESILAPGGAFYNGVNNRINNRLSTTTSVANFSTGDVAFLARSYSISGLAGFQNAAVVTKVVALLDAYAIHYYADPTSAQGWGGEFGPLGRAIHYIGPQLTPALLDTVADFGTGGTRTRRSAWGDMLFASREHGRLVDRRTLTNQAILADTNLYCANLGLLVIGDARAFPETVAQRYLRETAGLQPWLGNDLPDANANGLPDDGSEKPYGSNYWQITSKGMTREWGYVGAGYGELGYLVAGWYRLNGNVDFLNQAAKMARARGPFRRPAIEVSGASNFRTMEVIGLLAWRGVHESDGTFGGYVGYADTANTGGGAKAMLVAAATGDPVLIGYAKQMLADNQFFTYLDDSSSNYTTIEALEAFADYQTVKNAADSGIRLPMTAGRPDFAWSDEENGVMALKQGNDRLWVAPYWQAKDGTGINGVARFHFSTPTYDQYGVLETTPRFSTNRIFVRPDRVDLPERTIYLPNPAPSNAYAGELLPLGMAPAEATSDAPFRGRADFFAFRFGRFLIGMNAHPSNSQSLKTPVGFASATDLVSGNTVSGSITVAPMATVALDLGATSDLSPVPNAPLVLTATGSAAPSIALSWTAASGATTYTVRRSAAPGGPYQDLSGAIDLIGTSYTDTTVPLGSTFYYVIVAENAAGQSYESMEASASAGLPSPWTSIDLGTTTTIGLAGTSSYRPTTFTVTGSGTDVGSRSDSAQFAWHPVNGDAVLVARLASRSLSGSGGDKVGLMVRESLAANSRSFQLMIDRGQSDATRMSYRSSTNGSMVYPPNGPLRTPPVWLKVERAGNLFRSFVSSDGTLWEAVGEITISMAADAHFGFFACARSTSSRVEATFDNVTIQPGIWGLPPSAASDLTAIASPGQVQLTWSGPNDATSYQVRRSETSGGPYTTLMSVTSLSYLDTAVSNGTTYHYVIVALNQFGEATLSAEIAARPLSLVQTWRLEKFGTVSPSGDAADLADPDADGRANLIEYALGSEPLAALVDTRLVFSIGAGGIPRLSFNRIADPSLTYAVWATTDLTAWGTSPIWSSSGPENTSGNIVVGDVAGVGQARRFLRLTVETAP